MHINIIRWILLVVSLSVYGQTTITWNGNVNSDWNNAANWTPSNVPDISTEIALIDTQANIILNTSVTIYALNTSENVTIDLNNNDLNLTSTEVPNINNDVSIYIDRRKLTFTGQGILSFRNGFLRRASSNLTTQGRVDIQQQGTASELLLNSFSSVQIRRSNVNNGSSPTPRVQLQNINLDEGSFLNLSNTANDIIIRDLNFLDKMAIVELQDSENYIFTEAQDWSSSNCQSYNVIRSEIEGVRANLEFTVASVGDFNSYEDINVSSGTLTANNRLEKNCTNISGTTQTPSIVTSTQTGDWNDPNTWSDNCIPIFGDNVTIQSSHIVTIPNNLFVQVNNLTISSNGSLVSFTDTSGVSDDDLAIGASMADGSDSCNGCTINETIVFRDTQTSQQRQRVESYLALKYGITLNQTSETSYIASDASEFWDASGTITSEFNDDIFGIGKDVVSTLDQRISKSVNANTVLTIASDTNFTDTNTTHADILDDLEFITHANNANFTTGVELKQIDNTNATIAIDWVADSKNNYMTLAVFDSSGLSTSTYSSIIFGTVNTDLTAYDNVENTYIDIVSNNLGIVVTRVANTSVINNPIEGMLIYDNSSSSFQVNTDGTTSGWRALGSFVNPSNKLCD